MYTFQQKRAISQRIANMQEIERYRAMLMAVRHPGARKKMLDKSALAISLVYDLLGYYTEEQICSSKDSPVPVKLQRPSSLNQLDESSKSVKKKSRNLNSTRTSAGERWTTLSSALQTAYSRTVSICGSACEKLKKTLKVPMKWMPKR